MSEQAENNPWAQIALAITTQPGPDGNEMVSIHLGTLAMSMAFVIPADQADTFADAFADQVKQEARNARIKNGRISIIQNGKIR